MFVNDIFSLVFQSVVRHLSPFIDLYRKQASCFVDFCLIFKFNFIDFYALLIPPSCFVKFFQQELEYLTPDSKWDRLFFVVYTEWLKSPSPHCFSHGFIFMYLDFFLYSLWSQLTEYVLYNFSYFILNVRRFVFCLRIGPIMVNVL